MSDVTKEHELEAMLRQHAFEGSSGLLRILALCASVEDRHVSRTAATLDREAFVAWDRLHETVRNWPAPPVERSAFRSWLYDTERLGCARKALERLSLSSDAVVALRIVVLGVLEDLSEQVLRRDDDCLFAGVAAARKSELGEDIEPWAWLRSGTLAHFLSAHPDTEAELCRLWVTSALHEVDASQLRERLELDERLKNTLRDTLAEVCATIDVMRWSAKWSLDVATSDAEVATAYELLRMELPHLNGRLEVLQHAEGTWWAYPDGRSELVPWAKTTHEWTDPQLGVFATTIRVADPDPAQDVWHGLASLSRVADGYVSSRNVGVVDAFITALHHGDLGGALKRASDALDSGSDVDELTNQLVRFALEARLTIPETLPKLVASGEDVVSLHDALFDADEANEGNGQALLFIPDELYDECVDGRDVDTDAWWGRRAALNEAIPPGLVDNTLHVLGETSRQANAGVVSLASARASRMRREAQAMSYARTPASLRLAAASAALRPAFPDAACWWLRAGHSDQPQLPGCVPLLLLDEDSGKGLVAELRIYFDDKSDESLLWSDASVLRYVARESIRDAYYAAVACLPPTEFAPPLGMHRLELVLDADATTADDKIEIDGRSIALPAALAFVSVWAQQPIAGDLAAIGGLVREGFVQPVSAVTEKSGALSAYAAGRTLRFVTGLRNAEQVEAGLAKPVPNLRDALELAGVPLRVSGTQWKPSSKQQADALRGLMQDIEVGDLKRHGETASWEQLGDDLRALIRVLELNPTKPVRSEELTRARCWAALAFSHAGLQGDVVDLLKKIDKPSGLRSDVRTLVDIVRVGGFIDLEKLHDPEGIGAIADLQADIDELRAVDDHSYLGRALGTLGRAHMHRRELEAALPLLEEAVREHLAHQPYETARSRGYLSMALRMSSRRRDALEQLMVARTELETVTRDYSPEYEAATRPYLDYELARVLIEFERFDDAASVASRALAMCWAWWPRLGLLRTRAWAYRALGRDEDADADAAAASKLIIPGFRVTEAVAREAQGLPTRNGEIY